MNGIKITSICLIFLVLFCFTLNSCEISENILQSSSDVDFSSPQKVQISFNGRIYDTIVTLNSKKLEFNFINEKDLINGAYVCLTEKIYKITYMDMLFDGIISDLSKSFLPCIIYDFLASFEEKIVLDTYDKERGCYFVKRNINSYFVTLECYENDDNRYYSIEIK